MIDQLIAVLETHGIVGLCLGFFAYLCFDQQRTIKSLHKQIADMHHINAIKVEQTMESLERAIRNVETESAHIGGMVQMEAMRKR
jgi:hypothetical protein